MYKHQSNESTARAAPLWLSGQAVSLSEPIRDRFAPRYLHGGIASDQMEAGAVFGTRNLKITEATSSIRNP